MCDLDECYLDEDLGFWFIEVANDLSNIKICFLVSDDNDGSCFRVDFDEGFPHQGVIGILS